MTLKTQKVWLILSFVFHLLNNKQYDNFSNGSKNILEYIAKLENASKIIRGGDIKTF